MMSRARKFPVIAPALLILICCLFSRKSMAADVDLRTNVLYWATTTPNLGFDVATSGRFTIGATLGYNAFNFPNSAGNNHAVNPKLHHWLILPEGRWWLRKAFGGSYLGVHILGGQFNAGGLTLLKFIRDHRYRGYMLGAGISWGCDWHIGRDWRLGVQAGLSWVRLSYDKYNCGSCGRHIGGGVRNLPLVTPLGLTFAYVFPSRSRQKSDAGHPGLSYSYNSYKNSVTSVLTDIRDSMDVDPVIPRVQDHSESPAQAPLPDTLRFTVRYGVDSSEISARELRRLDSVIATVSDCHILALTTDGYASPEYDATHNRLLSSRRARAVADRIAASLDLPDSMVGVTGHGDDWDGLEREAGGITGVRMVLMTHSDPAARKRALSLLGTYDRLLRTVYPLLRRTEVQLIYIPAVGTPPD